MDSFTLTLTCLKRDEDHFIKAFDGDCRNEGSYQDGVITLVWNELDREPYDILTEICEKGIIFHGWHEHIISENTPPSRFCGYDKYLYYADCDNNGDLIIKAFKGTVDEHSFNKMKDFYAIQNEAERFLEDQGNTKEICIKVTLQIPVDDFCDGIEEHAVESLLKIIKNQYNDGFDKSSISEKYSIYIKEACLIKEPEV